MKGFNKNFTAIAFAIAFALGLISPIAAFAAGPATVNLGSAGNYVILSKTAITTTGVTSITGDIGISPAAASSLAGFGQTLDISGTFSTSPLVTGKIWASDYTAPTPANLGTAISAMQAAYVDASTRTPGTGASNLNVGGGTLNGQNFVPGTYTWGSNVDITGPITFTGAASDIWIIQISGTLALEANQSIILAGGALPQNIFWQVAGTTTIKPGASFSGIILAGPGASTIAMQSGAILNGRALGQTDVTLIGNTVSLLPVAPAPVGRHIIAPIIVPLIGILTVPAPLALPAGSGSVTYSYTVWNVGAQEPLESVTVADNKCAPVTFVSGDLNGNNLLDPGENWKYTCTTNLATTTTDTATAIGYSYDAYRTATIATALATVVVGVPATAPIVAVAAPLINIVKVPSQLTPFPFGGGNVTYTYTITNPGVVAIHDISVTDNKCAPVSLLSGDANANGLLDPGEIWIYTCQKNISASETNIGTVTGNANGFGAMGSAIATVLVAAPSLPNTGFPPRDPSTGYDAAIALAIVALVSVSLAIILKRRKA